MGRPAIWMVLIGGVVSLVSEYVKNNSVAIIASVLLHELMHIQFYNSHYLQIGSEQRRNEYLSYSAQLYFLVYAYSGAQKELECFNGGKNFTPDMPQKDLTEFIFFYNKVRDLR